MYCIYISHFVEKGRINATENVGTKLSKEKRKGEVSN
jgi:hypothetical protein